MVNCDIFISYRNTDSNGSITRDAVMAESLYKALRARGYNPFFSKYSLDNIGRSDYITVINNALDSARVFIAVGSSRENLNSRWVKREISVFSALMMREVEGSRTLLTYRSEDFPVDELPAALVDMQSYADEKAVVRFVDIVLKNAKGFLNDGEYTEIIYSSEGITAHRSMPTSSGNKLAGQSQLAIGSVLENRYQILSMIGEGGCSRVYLATDNRTQRKCAVKELRKNLSPDSGAAWSDFQHEVEIMRFLDHPAFPKLLDVIQHEDYRAIVMEYIEGDSLQTILTEKYTMEEKSLLGIARQLGQALEYLHTRTPAVIYRDVKPANIILQPDGIVKMIDFGTARHYRENTQSDTICLGTIGYAAPEQYGGMGQTDGRTDIYNFGVTLYYMATGKDPTRPPYEFVPVRQINPDLSLGLEAIIQKCIHKDPNRRYQSAKDLLKALDDIHKLSRRQMLSRNSIKQKKDAAQVFPPIPPSHKINDFELDEHIDRGRGISTVLGSTIPREEGFTLETLKKEFGIQEEPVGLFSQDPDTNDKKPAMARRNGDTKRFSPGLDATIEKLIALDPEAQLLIRKIIDRFSR